MTASRLNNEAMFHAARDIADPDRRRQYVRAACGADETRVAHLEALLAAADAPDSLLDHPAASGTEATLEQPTTESTGTVIGPYKLLEQIGEGGMGTVWMAQPNVPVKRVVALKLIKAGMDSKQVIARFEAERQALALMDHASIARVLDAGTTSAGRPYFVMDLVKGVPITRYCDEHHLTPRQRLELFIPVCQAIQHAHQKGVIHRDLKPSNVLIALYDGKPVPKVIDFGIAKAAGQALTEKTLVTGFGSIVGTLEYMSPEQAEMNQLDIDTRSDIYSLGVLLYELLTGSPPFTRKQLEQSGVLEMLRVIREQEPTKPSTKLSTAERLPTLAANRGTEPARLTRLVRGELDWIVMKALEKDRARRYETANAFAMDIDRYLNDEPVQACPPSAMYRVRKFARRNKRVAVVASFAFALLVVAVGALAASYAQVQRALEREKETTYLQRTALAGRELAAGNVAHAEELLDDCPEHLRGWEWHFLKRQRYDGEPTRLRHSETVVHVAFSPDDSQLATARMDGTLTIWDARTGRIVHTLEQQIAPGRIVPVDSLAYSPDGRYLALARRDGTVLVWNPARAQPLHTLRGHEGAAGKVAFSPDSRTLASGGADGTVRLWDMTSGESLRVFPNHPVGVRGVAFRPDGRSVLAACQDGTVTVWDRDTRRPTFSFRGKLRNPGSAWFSPDARRLARSSFDGVLKVWDTTTGKLEIDQQTNTWQLRSVAFAPDGKRMALACFDGTVRLLDMAGREMLTIFAHSSVVADAVFNRDGTKIASASYDHTVRIWDATPLEPDPQAGSCVTLTGHKALVTGVAFSPDGRWLASASWDGTVKLWEAGAFGTPERTPRYTLRSHSGNVSSVAFSADNRTLASGSWDKTVKLWDLQTPVGDSLAELRPIPCGALVLSVAFSPDGQVLAIGQGNGIALYDPAYGKDAAPFKRTLAPVPAVAFSPDGRYLGSAAASEQSIKFWDVAGEKMNFQIRIDSTPSSCVAISPDGRLIAANGSLLAGAAPTLKIWKVLDWDARSSKTHEEWRTLSGHSRYVFKVAFSPDGRYLASGSWDATIKIWDLEALARDPKAEPVTLRGHAGPIYGLTFSSDSRRLASGSGYADHGEVQVWDASLWEHKSSGGVSTVANTGQRKQVD
jgi:WD40 repeat protein/serine/threonine protein kinase